MTTPNFTAAEYPLPLTIEEITPKWLTHALSQKFPGTIVEDCDITDIISGTCTKIRLRLKLNAAGLNACIPETVILKGGFEPHSRSMFVTHEKEVRAYRDLFPEFGLPSPICYFADFDIEHQQGIVIIEDLLIRGATFCHPQKPQSHEEVANRLRLLAQFHARSWGNSELQAGGRWAWAHDYLESSKTYMKQYFSPEAWAEYARSSQGAAASVYFHNHQRMIDSLSNLADMAKDLPRCIIHGDTHLGNLYIDTDGTPGFFDPQPMQAPSIVEVTYHIAAAMDPIDRRKSEYALIQHYLDELKRQGIKAPGFQDALKQYSVFLALGYCIFFVNSTQFQTEAINTVCTARFSIAMIDNRTLENLEQIQELC